MKISAYALASMVAAGSLFALVLVACSDSSDSASTSPDASVAADTGSAEVDDANRIPCAPRAVLQAICQQCHARPTKNGAPFPLERLSDVLATRSGDTVRADMIDQLTSGRMPLSPVTISAADKETLLAWLDAGAPAVEATSCAAVDGGSDGGDAGQDAGDGGGDAGDDASDGAM